MSEIVIRPGVLGELGARMAERMPVGTAAVISDDRVMPLYGAKVSDSLARAGFRVCKFAFPHGELNKTLATYAEILDFLARERLTRADCVVALGGGVTGDMAGFAAATYLRGLRLVQAPTTLLACVDSSVGGKTAVDLPAGKNLVGAFHLPALVAIDPDALSTLPEAVFRDGCAEVIKHAAILDRELFALLPRMRENLPDVIARNVAIKKGIVDQDERETGIRAILNFGHTFGHAIEKASGYSVGHGAAVAAGMAIMARACAARGICARAEAEALIGLIGSFSLPTATEYPPDALYEVMLSDKKRAGDAITLVVLREIGNCALYKTTLAEARAFLEAGWTPW